MRTVSVPVSMTKPYLGSGIQYKAGDLAQPYRVWHANHIVQFTEDLHDAIAVQNLVDTYGVEAIDETYDKWEAKDRVRWPAIVQLKFMEESSV